MKRLFLLSLIGVLICSCVKERDPRDEYCGEYIVQVNVETQEWTIYREYNYREYKPHKVHNYTSKITISKDICSETMLIIEGSCLGELVPTMAYVSYSDIHFVDHDDYRSGYSDDDFVIGGSKFRDVNFKRDIISGKDTLFFTSYKKHKHNPSWSETQYSVIDNFELITTEYVAIKQNE